MVYAFSLSCSVIAAVSGEAAVVDPGLAIHAHSYR